MKDQGLIKKYDVKKLSNPEKEIDAIVLEFDDPISRKVLKYYASKLAAAGYSKFANDLVDKVFAYENRVRVFEFSVQEDWIDWVVASDKDTALAHLKEVSDMGDEEMDEQRTCKELTEDDLDSLKYDPDPDGSGELDNERVISFRQAINANTDKLPYLLCSQVD